MEEKVMKLDESDLEGIVGGAFNQSAIERLGLKMETNKRTGEARMAAVNLYAVNKSNPGMIDEYKISNDTLYEGQLKRIVGHYAEVSMSAMTTSGEMKTLSKNDIADLLNG